MNPRVGRLPEGEIAAAHAAGAAAAIDFKDSLQKLRGLLSQADQVEILARAGFFTTLAQLPSSRDRKVRLEVFQIELLQALCLAAPRANAPLSTDFPSLVSAAISLIETNEAAYRGRSKSAVTADPGENEKRELIDLVQGWTLAVRGPRHPSQTRSYMLAIATQIDAVFRNTYGCGAIAAAEMLERVMTLMEKRMRGLMESARGWLTAPSASKMIEAYVASLPPASAQDLRCTMATFATDRGQVMAHLWNRMERDFASVLTFGFEDLAPPTSKSEREALAAILDALSMGFGDVDDAALEHLHLSNPVRLKPFIKLGENTYFLPCPTILGVQMSEIFQALAVGSQKLSRRLEVARAGWLEERVEALVTNYLPRAEVRRSVKWLDTDGVTAWETDIVALIDQTVLVFEAKSGKVSPPARRGAEVSLRADLNKLIGDASAQSARFKARIEGATQPVTFSTTTGDWTLDPAEVREVIRINVLLDTIGPLSAHWPRLMACGMLRKDADIAPSMSVFELETVFQALTLQIERCHYLGRRGELERSTSYVADELDLLALYLENQFNFAQNSDHSGPIRLYGLSEGLARAFAEPGERLPSFPIKRRPLFARLLRTVEELGHKGWTRFGRRLLSVDYAGQRTMERLVESGWKKVRRKDPDAYFTSGITVGLPHAPQAIGFCIGSAEPTQFQRNLQHAARNAMAPEDLDDALVIYWFRPKSRHEHAYDFIGTVRNVSAYDLASGKVRPSSISGGAWGEEEV